MFRQPASYFSAVWMVPLLILASAGDLPTVYKNEQNHTQYAFTLLPDVAKRISNHECWNRLEKQVAVVSAKPCNRW
jgi:hypothetical protein